MTTERVHLNSLDLRWKGDAEARYAALWEYLNGLVAEIREINPSLEIEVVIHAPDEEG